MSVLIPARNEERSIRAALNSVLATHGVHFELIVLDDHSEDRTGAIVREVASQDDRVRLIESAPLPDAWCGKQFACHQLAQVAKHELLLFLDADVRMEPDGIARLIASMEQTPADLVSGVPRQETGSLAERLVIPLIHFLLLGYLPLAAMRTFRHPAWAAGCGQLILVRRSAYDRACGHAAIRHSLHDGIALPTRISPSRTPHRSLRCNRSRRLPHVSIRPRTLAGIVEKRARRAWFAAWNCSVDSDSARRPGIAVGNARVVPGGG